MAVQSRDDFLAVLSKSRLLTPEQSEEAARLTEGIETPSNVARKLVNVGLLSRWQAGQMLAGKHASLISKYRLLDLVGNEPLGPVFLAEHTQMDRRVILKTLAKREGNSSNSIEQFLGEAQALALLDHRNLSHIYDVDRDGDFYYLVMENVQGRSLDQMVSEQGPLPLESAAGLVALACDAVSHAHQQGIVHLGIRPDRIIVDHLGELKVLDIGVARLTRHDGAEKPRPAPRTAENVDCLSPEQLDPKVTPGPLADQYALGCVLYYLLCGQGPFASNGDGPRQRRADDRVPNVRGMRSEVPVQLAEICRRMTSLRPEGRFEDLSKAAGALESWLKTFEPEPAAAATPVSPAAVPTAVPPRPQESQTVVATPPRKAETQRQTKQSRLSKPSTRWLLFAGGGTLLVLAGALLAYFLKSDSDEPPTQIGHRNRPIGQGTDSGDPTIKNPGEAVAEDPSAPVPMEIEELELPKGVRSIPMLDKSVRIQGENPATAVYTLMLPVELNRIDGIQLEVLPDESGESPVVGRAADGSFRLTEIKLEVDGDKKFETPREQKFVRAESANDLPGYPASAAIDGSAETHWSSDKSVDKEQVATFWLQTPVVFPAGRSAPLWFRITLDQLSGDSRSLARFRLSAVTGTPKSPENGDPNSTPVAIDSTPPEPLPVLGYWRFEAPSEKADPIPGSPTVADESGKRNHLFLPEGGAEPQFSQNVPVSKVESLGLSNSRSYQAVASNEELSTVGGLTTDSSRGLKPSTELSIKNLPKWTIEASFRLDRLGMTHGLLGLDGVDEPETPSPLQLRVRGDTNRLEAEVFDANGQAFTVQSTEPIQAARWYHAAVVRDEGKLLLYLDSLDGQGMVLQEEKPYAGPDIAESGGMSIGRGFHDGAAADEAAAQIDEVRVTALPLPPQWMLLRGSRPTKSAEAEAQAVSGQGAAVAGAQSQNQPIQPHPLTILDVRGPEGVQLTRQFDGSYLASGESPEKAEYVIEAYTDLKSFSGLRLEALADQSLPAQGPGRNNAQVVGNFVVSKLSVSVSSRRGERLSFPVKFKQALADFSQRDFPITSAAGLSGQKGWAIAPKMGQGHWAVFLADQPLGYPSGTWLTIRIEQNFGLNFTLGRFRLSAITGEKVSEVLAEDLKKANELRDPLAGLKQSIDLPKVTAEEGSTIDREAALVPVSLGKVPRILVEHSDVRLHGGFAADEEGTTFAIMPTAGEEGVRRWMISARLPGPVDAERQTVEAAVVELRDEELTIRWTEAALRQPSVNYLRNCALRVDAAEFNHGIALREPILGTGFPLTLGRGQIRLRPEIPWLPRRDQLRVELLPDEKVLPKYILDNQLIEAAGGTAQMYFAIDKGPTLLLTIESNIGRVWLLKLDPFYFTEADARHIVLNMQRILAYQQRVTAQKQRIDRVIPGLKDAEKTNAEKASNEAGNAIKQVTSLINLVEKVSSTGTLPFRIVNTVEDYPVILYDGTGAPPAVEAKE